MRTVLVNREELLSRGEVARLLGVSRETLKGWARRGVGPAFSRSGPVRGRVWYQTADVIAWLESRKRVSSAAGVAVGPPNPARVPEANHRNPIRTLYAAGPGGTDEKSADVFHAAKEGDA